MNIPHIPPGSNWSDFIAMGGQGRYVWSALGIVAAALLIELAQLRLRRSRQLSQQLFRQRDAA
ncbi:MAG: heme exporter protein CcmD [Burkholderiaceae bacterium]|nr:heme exporter protein CcmD [Roseateles sp.]MBV8470758.1 heme exporter protein CcmD [Burkholderiaceae bacterium]